MQSIVPDIAKDIVPIYPQKQRFINFIENFYLVVCASKPQFFFLQMSPCLTGATPHKKRTTQLGVSAYTNIRFEDIRTRRALFFDSSPDNKDCVYIHSLTKGTGPPLIFHKNNTNKNLEIYFIYLAELSNKCTLQAPPPLHIDDIGDEQQLSRPP